MIVWREKFKATGIHFLVTLTFATCAAALVFLVWFPDPLQTMVGGTRLFALVTTCDLVLGPLVSLIIYNSRKTRRALVFDYVVIGAIQISALVYGLSVLAGSRPVYVAFSTDRLEIVEARDITDQELAAANNPRYRSLPLTGPRYISIKVPDSEHNEALFEELKGNEVHLRPRFYAPYESLLPQIRAHAGSIAALEKRHPASKPLIEAASGKLRTPASRLAWLPVHHSKGFATALIDTEDGKPLAYVEFDPF
ncbi:MAG: TfpX/TfpZ family type IV pilin accessory protein [Pseudomonadota bacterium]